MYKAAEYFVAGRNMDTYMTANAKNNENTQWSY